MANYLLITVTVLLSATAQLFIKQGMTVIGPVSFDTTSLVAMILKAATNIFVLFGVAAYSVSVVLWLVVLSRVNVSWAYPFLSIGYILIAVFAWAFFHEPLSSQKIIGIIVICIGIAILSISKG